MSGDRKTAPVDHGQALIRELRKTPVNAPRWVTTAALANELVALMSMTVSQTRLNNLCIEHIKTFTFLELPAIVDTRIRTDALSNVEGFTLAVNGFADLLATYGCLSEEEPKTSSARRAHHARLEEMEDRIVNSYNAIVAVPFGGSAEVEPTVDAPAVQRLPTDAPAVIPALTTPTATPVATAALTSPVVAGLPSLVDLTTAALDDHARPDALLTAPPQRSKTRLAMRMRT